MSVYLALCDIWRTSYLCRFTAERDESGKKRIYISFSGWKACTDLTECRANVGLRFEGSQFSNLPADQCVEYVFTEDDDPWHAE